MTMIFFIERTEHYINSETGAASQHSSIDLSRGYFTSIIDALNMCREHNRPYIQKFEDLRISLLGFGTVDYEKWQAHTGMISLRMISVENAVTDQAVYDTVELALR
jgi:hypothetical protein